MSHLTFPSASTFTTQMNKSAGRSIDDFRFNYENSYGYRPNRTCKNNYHCICCERNKGDVYAKGGCQDCFHHPANHGCSRCSCDGALNACHYLAYCRARQIIADKIADLVYGTDDDEATAKMLSDMAQGTLDRNDGDDTDNGNSQD